MKPGSPSVPYTPFLLILLANFGLAGCSARRSDPAAQTPTARATPQIVFEDVAPKGGITYIRANGAAGNKWMPESVGGGGGFIDYNGDGYLDIILVNGDWWPGHPLSGPRPTLHLYRNNRNGTFTDVSDEVGLNVSLPGMGLAVGDFNNDGFDDLFITGVNQCHLFRNEHGRRFTDITPQSRVNDTGWSTSAAWVDVDNDGKLDLFVCNYVKWTPATDAFCGVRTKVYCEPSVYEADSCRLYHNEGNDRFRDVTREAGLLTHASKGLGVCILDVNDDGRMDVFVANDTAPNQLYVNEGNGTFKEVAKEYGIAVGETGKARAGMGIDSADCGGNGSQTVAIGNFTNEGLGIYDLSGKPPYFDKSSEVGTSAPSVPWVTFAVLFADLDNDGLPDLLAANGHIDDTIPITHPGQLYKQPCVLLRDVGNGNFVDVSAAAGPAVTNPTVGRGASKGDFDNDGKIDILLTPNTGPCRLLHNVSRSTGHWLLLKPEGTKSNRDGYGAKVTVQAGGRTQVAYCRSGSGYLSANDPRVHFGVGAAATVDRIAVRWPSGLTEAWEAVPADRIMKLREGSGRRL